MSYAIDFGTSNTVITRWNPATGNPETVRLTGLSQQLAGSPPLIPSLLYVEDANCGQVTVGQAVRDRGLDLTGDPRFFRSFKRGIGTQIQGFLPELEGKIVTFEQVGEWFFKTLIGQLKADLGKTLSCLTLTVPVDSFEAYRHWLTQTCQGWEIEQVRILDEPTAAALGYGATAANLLLAIDFGGGTIDFSLIQLDSSNLAKTQGFILKLGNKLFGNSSGQKTKVARVLAKAGKNLGGTDIDAWVVDYFQQTQALPKSSLTLRLAERLKIKLSDTREATEVFFDDRTFASYSLSLDRDRFEHILQEQQFFAQLDDLMCQILQQARRNGIEKTDIDTVLLVGGTVQIPAVTNWVKQYFDESKIQCDRPLEAVALGALQLAQGFELQDFLYHSYGIRYWNRRKNCHSWHPIIKAGQPYPMEEPIELKLGASTENQPNIELIIGELGAETGSTEVYFDGDRLVTRSLETGAAAVQTLNDHDGARTIARLNPVGNPGSDRVRVQFWVDRQRFLRLSVRDLLTQESLLDNQIVAQLS